MKKKGKKVLAILMAALMVVGIMPMDWAAVKVDAADENKHVFNAETVLSAMEGFAGDAGKKKEITDGTALTDYFKTVGKTMRGNSSTYSVEVKEDAASAIQFTVTGKADVTFTATSTGSSNTSMVGLIDASDNVIPESNGTTKVTGTATPVTMTYTGLTAGTYRIVSTVTDDSTLSRGVRILTAKVTETTGGERPARKA